MDDNAKTRSDFIRQAIDHDLAQGRFNSKVHTRFPPEPNGFLHIGHAKAICLNFGIAQEYDAPCNLRFDDTNPSKEETRYVDAIQQDIRWLGFEWQHLCYASDYFQQLYDYAVALIQTGKAYVCSLDAEQTRLYRGTLTEPGKNSPYRERRIEENLSLFEQMRRGEFQEGEHALRAKIDMASPNINMRDPIIYRIMHQTHHRTEDDWSIYPTYDFTHCLSDSIEQITHSLCTLEFEDHRPLYDWFLDALALHHPQQIEFARLQLSYTITSKRKLKQLVDDNIVSGWDDPRMPTIAGMRKRGIPAVAIRDFCGRIGLTKNDSRIEMSLFETCVRDNLNQNAQRIMAVIRPLKIVIENYPDDKTEMIDIANHPANPDMGTRPVPFTNTLYIEHDDFMETPEKGFFRLAPGREVRLKYGYYITCKEVIKDDNGNVIELRCLYDPEVPIGQRDKTKKTKGIIHWVSAHHTKPIEVRLYDRLFRVEDPATEQDLMKTINPQSLITLPNAVIEASAQTAPGHNRVYQFERLGYFVASPDTASEDPVFNRVITIRDSWKKARTGKQSFGLN